MSKLPNINIPISQHKFEGSKIYDPVRKKYVECTPEEWVRQNLMSFLVKNYGYTFSKMQVEKGLTINDKPFRLDVICHDSKGNPYLIVECKSPSVKLNQSTLNQIGIYNIAKSTKYLMVTNGLDFLVFETDYENQTLKSIPNIPNAS